MQEGHMVWRKIAFHAAMAMFASAVLVAAETAGAGEDLTRIFASGFENEKLGNWTLEPKGDAGTISIGQSSVCFAGACALQVKTTAAASGKRDAERRYYYPIPLGKAGAYKELRFSVRARAEGCAAGEAFLSVLEANVPSNWLEKKPCLAVIPVSSDWRLLTFTGKPKLETSKIVFYVQIKNTAPIGATAYLDDLAVDGVPVGAGVETVFFAGFEDEKSADWTLETKSDAASISVGRSGAAYAGAMALEVRTTAAAGGKPDAERRYYRQIPLGEAGMYKELRFSVRTRAHGCAVGDAFLSVLEGNVPPSWLERKASLAVIPVSDDWQFLTFTGKPKPETAKVVFFIQIKNTAPAGTVVQLDDLRVEGLK